MRILTALAGMSGRFAEMSVQVAPASRDSKTWPMPAPGPSVQCREKPLIADVHVLRRWPGRRRSRTRTGSGIVPSTGRLSWCQPVPSVLPTAMPRVKPWLLQGPHQPTYTVPPETATAVAVCPAPRSNTLVQSPRPADGEALVLHPHVMAAGDPGVDVLRVRGERGDEPRPGRAEVVVRRGDVAAGHLARVRGPRTVVDRAVVGHRHGQVDVLRSRCCSRWPGRRACRRRRRRSWSPSPGRPGAGSTGRCPAGHR